jgi:chromosome segregation ATPase
MTDFLDKEQHIMDLLNQLEPNDDVDSIRDLVNELAMLLQVKSLDIEELNSKMIEQEERLKLVQSIPMISQGNDSTLSTLSNELVEERRKIKELTIKLNEAEEENKLLENGNIQSDIWNQKLLEKDNYIKELFANLAFERKQRDALIQQYKDQEQRMATVGEKEQQVHNLRNLYNTERSKRENAQQTIAEKEEHIKKIQAELNEEKGQHESTKKFHREQSSTAEQMKSRMENYNDIVKQLADKSQLVQKVTADLVKERQAKASLNQKVQELERSLKKFPALEKELGESKNSIETLKIQHKNDLEQGEHQHKQSLESLRNSHKKDVERLENEFKTRWSQIEKEKETLKTKHSNLEKERDDFKMRCSQLEKESAEKTSIITKLRSEDKNVSREIETINRQEVEQLRIEKDKEVKDLQEKIKQLTKSLKDIEQSHRSANEHKENLQKSLNATKKQLEEKHKLVETHSSALKTYEEKLKDHAHIKKKISHMEKHVQDKQHDYERLFTDFQLKTSHLESEKNARVEMVKQLTDLQKQLATKQQELLRANERQIIPPNISDKDLADKIMIYERKIRTLENEVKIQMSDNKTRKLEMEIRSLRNQLEEKDRLVNSVNNTAFVKHLEGSIKQLKAKLDYYMKEVQKKDEEIERLIG